MVMEIGEKGLSFTQGAWLLGQLNPSKTALKVERANDATSPPAKHSWLPPIINSRVQISTENATIESLPWSKQVPPREPCYLVELLDQGWFEKNVLAPRVSKIPKHPSLSPLYLNDSGSLLRKSKSYNYTGINNYYNSSDGNQAWCRAPSPEEVGLDEMESQRRGRLRYGSRGRMAQERRSSSVDAVRLARVGENGKVENWKPHMALQKRSVTISGERLSDVARYRSQVRCRSLTDTDLEELQGFMDLGFQFPREQTSPEISETLPALKLYHAVESVQSRLTSSQSSSPSAHKNGCRQQQLGSALCSVAEGLANSPSPALLPSLPEPWMLPLDDHPANVKMHLRVWARTVASAVRQAA